MGVALALVAAIGLYLLFSIRSQPASEGASFSQQVREGARKMIAAFQPKPEPARPPPPKPQAQVAKPQPQAQLQPQPKPQAQPEKAAAPAVVAPLEAGRSWRYAVKVEPEVWKNVVLTYRTAQEQGGLGVRTEFQHAGGKSAFHLGFFAANHPTHANTRFPGFFMYASYLKSPLAVGQAVEFSWPWQGKPGGTKRYQGTVRQWADVALPSGTLRAAEIDGQLSYIDQGKVVARAQETFWYAPRVAQVVKIERQGVVPDESLHRIVAELAEYR
jgi:hypothetical protein